MVESKNDISDIKDTAQAFDAWLNLAGKLAAFVLLLALIFLPHHVPLLNRFILKSSKINIMGTELQVVDSALLGKGVEITADGKLLVSGIEVNDIYDNNAKLKQAVKDLNDKNVELSDNIQAANSLLADTKTQLDEANRRLHAASAGSPEISPLPTKDLTSRITSLGADSSNKLNASVQVSAQTAAVVQENVVLPAVGFGIVFAGDKTPEAAMDEVRKAGRIAGFANPVILYKRQGFWRSVAYFGSRDKAAELLPQFKTIWPEAYQVDISNWCPAPVRISAEKPSVMAEQKDCNF